MRDVRIRGFSKLTRINDALSKFFENTKIERLSSEDVQNIDSLGRVLAENIIAPFDIPNFNRAAVDGYAVRSKDTFGADSTNPLVFDVIASVEAGDFPKASIKNYQAIKITTGAPIPEGADSVIMVEYTEKISENKIEIYYTVPPKENISIRGEDVRKGKMIFSKGKVLHPQDIGLLAALGISIIPVVKKPSVAIFSTGNELIKPGQRMMDGKIYDANRPIIITMAKILGCEPIDLGISRDDPEAMKTKLVEGLTSDIIVVSGATSVGEKDFMPEVVNALGKPGVIVHGISMRPGKATALAVIDNKPIILLPGFPVAAMIAFNVFVKPIILKMLGTSNGQMGSQIIRASVSRRVPSYPGNRTFVRVLVKKIKKGYVVEPLRTLGSGIISSIVKANGLVVIPENKEGLEKDEKVEVILLRNLEGNSYSS